MKVTSILLSLYYFLDTRVIATYTASCWKMKRKPVTARRSAGEQRGAKSQKIHSKRPILSSSVSSSSGLNMGEAHLWTHDEEIALFREAHVLLTTQQFSQKSQLNEELARVLNGCFPEVAIKFTSNTIKNKVTTFKSRWRGGRPLLTCNRAQIECSAIVANFFLSGITGGSETTSSVAADSVNVNNGRIPTIQNVNNRRIPTIQECVILAESLEGLTPIEKADASELMRLDPAAREAFMSFNDEQVRLLWIKKLIGPVNNPGTA